MFDPRLLRGGSWYNRPMICRSANRNYAGLLDLAIDIIGFRLVCLNQGDDHTIQLVEQTDD